MFSLEGEGSFLSLFIAVELKRLIVREDKKMSVELVNVVSATPFFWKGKRIKLKRERIHNCKSIINRRKKT